MGTDSIVRICPIKNATEKQLHDWVASKSDEDRSEHGHEDGYSGYWNSCSHGLQIYRKILSETDAKQFLYENVEKRGLGAVQVPAEKEGPSFTTTTQFKSLIATVAAAEAEARKVEIGAYHVRKARTGLIGCTNCGSRIAVKHLDICERTCPVCGGGEWFGYMVADVKKIATAQKKHKQAEEKLAAEEAKYKAKHAPTKEQGFFWLVLGSCPS